MAFMGGSRLALLREARQQAEGNMDRAERGGQGLRRAILDYGSETRAYQDLGIRKDQNRRAAERWALQKKTLEEAALAAEAEARRKAAQEAMKNRFAVEQAQGDQWSERFQHGFDLPARKKMLDEYRSQQEAYDSAYGGMSADEDVDDLLSGAGSVDVDSILSGAGADRGDTGAYDDADMSPDYAGGGQRIMGPLKSDEMVQAEADRSIEGVREVRARNVLETARRIKADLEAEGHQVDLGEVVDMVAKRDLELDKHEAKQADHVKKDEEKQLAIEEMYTQNHIDSLKIDKMRDELVNDLPKNIGAFALRNESRFLDALKPHTGGGEDPRDPEMLELAAIFRKQLGITRDDPKYDQVMRNEYFGRMKAVTDELAKKKTVKGPEAVANYIKRGMRKKPDEKTQTRYKMVDSAVKNMAIRKANINNAIDFATRLEAMTQGDPRGSSKMRSLFETKFKDYFDGKDMTYAVMEGLSGEVLSNWVREVSGLTVTDNEAERLRKVLPGMDKDPGAVIALWNEWIDRQYDNHVALVDEYTDAGQMDWGEKNISGIKWEKGRGKKKSQLMQGRRLLKNKSKPRMVDPQTGSEEIADDDDELKALIVKGYIVVGAGG
jgi:hypothetical protein